MGGEGIKTFASAFALLPLRRLDIAFLLAGLSACDHGNSVDVDASDFLDVGATHSSAGTNGSADASANGSPDADAGSSEDGATNGSADASANGSPDADAGSSEDASAGTAADGGAKSSDDGGKGGWGDGGWSSTPKNTCPTGPLLERSPIAPADLWSLAPLGSLIPDNHTFPTPHMYFYVVDVTAGIDKEAAVSAPAHMFVTSASKRVRTSSAGTITTLDLDFVICDEVTGYFINLRRFTGAVLTAFSALPCTLTGTPAESTCQVKFSPALELRAGDSIGTTGDIAGGVGGMDVGLRDTRIANGRSAFANPERFCKVGETPGRNRCFVACPLDYMPSTLATQIGPLFVDRNGIQMDATPACGLSVYFDFAGTALGYWFPATGPSGPSVYSAEQYVLYTGPNDYKHAYQTFSLGDSFDVATPSLVHGNYTFAPQTTGKINRDFKTVTDSAIYCYDTLYSQVRSPLASGPAVVNRIVLIQLDATAATLTVDAQQAATCGTGPWTMSAGAVRFSR